MMATFYSLQPSCNKLLFFLLLLLSNVGIAQDCPDEDLFFTRQSQLDSFAILYPDCRNLKGGLGLSTIEGLTNLNALQQVLSIKGNFSIASCQELTNLEGLENLKSIEGELIIANCNQLDNLDGIGNLRVLQSYFRLIANDRLRRLTTFSDLLPDMENLFFQDNPMLSDLKGLERVRNLKEIHVENCDGLLSFEDLHHLEKIERSLIIVYNDQLASLKGLEAAGPELRQLVIFEDNQLTNLDGLENIQRLSSFVNISSNASLENVDALENLQEVKIIGLINNARLSNIDGLRNVRADSVSSLRIEDNPNLSTCSNELTCTYLQTKDDYTISNNADGCRDSSQILHVCQDISHQLWYRFYYDLNRNGQFDSNELYYPGASLLIDPLGVELFATNNEFNVFYIPPGRYDVSFNQAANSNLWISSSTASFNLLIDDDNPIDTVEFGIYPREEFGRMVSSIYSPIARCGTIIELEASSQNLGSTILDGTLWMEVDSLLNAVLFRPTPDTIASQHRAGWRFKNLLPGQSLSVKAQVQIPIPGQFQLGDSLSHRTYTVFEGPTSTGASNQAVQSELIRCSYDPNDKLVSPNREGGYTLFEEDLVYTVRFQNTGNDVAFDVVIRDTLHPDLDLSTFRYLNSSHPEVLTTTLTDCRELIFDFQNIFLPDSTSDLEGSQGYVSYTIAPNDGLEENSTITNTAGIYFDFNPPIITNTTENVLVSQLPGTVGIERKPLQPEFKVFPNPTADRIQLYSSSQTSTEFQLYDLQGRLVRSGQFVQTDVVSTASLSPGLYWLHLRNGEGESWQKLVRQ
ncbi:MAG: T9SS type A sorting domain-containing protein [Bacteroidota bacterium]